MSLFFPIIDEQPCAAQLGFPFQPYVEPKRQSKKQNISVVANPPSQVNTAEDEENFYILLRKQKLQHPLLKFNNGFDSYEIKYLRNNNTVTIAITSAADKYKKSYEFDADAVDETNVSWELVEPQAMLIKIPKVVNRQVKELEELRAEIKRQRNLLVSQRKEFERQLALEKQKTAQLEKKLQQISQQQAFVERQAQRSFQEAAEVQRQLMKQLNEARQQVQQQQQQQQVQQQQQQQQVQQQQQQVQQQQQQQQSQSKAVEPKESQQSRVNALDALDAAFSKFFETKNKKDDVISVTIHTAEADDPPVSSLTDEASSADESGPGTPDSSDNEDESMSDDKEYVVLKKPEQPKKRTRKPSLEDMEDEEFSAFSD